MRCHFAGHRRPRLRFSSAPESKYRLTLLQYKVMSRSEEHSGELREAAKLIGRLNQDTPLRLVVSFKFRAGTDPEGYVKSIYDPSSPNYRHYLTPQSFADLFAPSPTDYQLVVNWLRLKGFAVTRTAPDRLMIEVSANSGKSGRSVQYDVLSVPISKCDILLKQH